MNVAQSVAAPISFAAPKNGAMLRPLMALSYYPLDESDSEEKVRTSVELPLELHLDVQFLADLWNEIDKTLGKRRRRKWKAASVQRRLIEVGVAGFWQQVGGRPATKQDRQEFVAQALERLRKPSKK